MENELHRKCTPKRRSLGSRWACASLAAAAESGRNISPNFDRHSLDFQAMHSLLHRNAEGASWSTTRRWPTLTHELLDRFCIMGLYLGLDNTPLLVAVVTRLLLPATVSFDHTDRRVETA